MMIKSIKIKNFKSIVDAKVNLSRLTVLIGANGTGKSNLVKALSFIGAIPNRGIATAVNHYGGFDTLIPRTLSRKEARKHRIGISCRFIQPRPDRYPSDCPPIAADYELELGYNYATDEALRFRVSKEKLTFHQVLALAHVLSTQDDEELDKQLLASISSFTLLRGTRGGISHSASPPMSEQLRLYGTWLGVPRIPFKFVKELENMLNSIKHINQTSNKEKKSRTVSFLDPDISTILNFSPQARRLISQVANIKRYDLLLSQLRIEQIESGSEQLADDGSNMPIILRNLRTNPDKKTSWERILNTFETIAPHIETVKSKQLRTGKEFIEFIETNTGNQGIASWSSSDGTLRALALLLAIETHPRGSTVLIEEPEQNLHPWAVRTIVDHIRQVIDERNLQVILTTHSQQVLEKTKPDEVLVVTRKPGQGTKFMTLAEILPDSKIMMGEIGELWVQGLLGGVPSDE